MTDPLETLHDWCEFGEHRAYILMAIARATHNDQLSSNAEPVHRRVITSTDEIDDAYHNLDWLTARHETLTFRLYLTVNARNTLEAFFNFRETSDQWVRDYINGDQHAAPKFGEVSSRWKSELHQPACRDDRYFQFDLDDVDEDDLTAFSDSIAQTGGTVILERETPNGYHVLTEPFNYEQWNPPVEYDDLDTDGQLFIDVFDGN